MKVNPSAITFTPFSRDRCRVKLGNKIAGAIRMVASGYQYFPKGSDTGGEIHPTLAACKKSLLED